MEHPSFYIREEMDARGWNVATMARHMSGDFGTNYLAIDMYLAIGPERPGLRLGTMAADLGRAFGVSEALFQNLEAAWLRSLETPAATSPTPKGQDTQKDPT